MNCNPIKLASITTYFQKSRIAHNIKDLEKHLPSVASINGMQVKGTHAGLDRSLCSYTPDGTYITS